MNAFGQLEADPPVVPTALQETASSRALAWLGQAFIHEMQGNVQQAVEAYEQAIQSDPENDRLYQVISQRLLENDRIDQAFALLETLRQRQPCHVQTLRWLAQLYLEQNQPGEAFPLLQQAVAQHPAQEEVYLLTLQLALRQQEVEEALRIARLGRNHAETHQRLTRIAIQLLTMQSRQADDLQGMNQALDEARRLREEAITAYPNTPVFLLEKAAQAIEAGRLTEALDLYREADRRETGRAAFRMTLLVHLIQGLGGNPEAMQTARTFLEEQTEPDVLSLYLLGCLQNEMDEARPALRTFQRAQTLSPQDPAIQQQLAYLYYRNDQPRQAASQVREALRQRPDQVVMRQLAGQLALIAGDFASAIQHFEALIRLSKEGKAVEELPDVYARYAMALLALNRNVRAVDAMAEAVPQQPESLEQIWGHHLRLGLRSDDIERRDAYARQMLEVLYDLSDRLPDHPGVESRIGNTYLFKHNFSDAIAAFERAAALAEEHPRPAIWLTTEFFFDWGNALERSGRIEEAVTVFNRVLTLNPNHHQTLNYLAYMWAERGENLDQAMEYIEKALEETPNNGSYIDTLGWIHYQRGELEPARAALQTAADLEPMEPVILEHLADTLLALNQPLQAAGYYRIALEMEEQEPEQHHRIQVRLQQAMDAVTAGIQAP